MILPNDVTRCVPKSNGCACKEQCKRFTDIEPDRIYSFCDPSVLHVPGVPCEMLIKADE